MQIDTPIILAVFGTVGTLVTGYAGFVLNSIKETIKDTKEEQKKQHEIQLQHIDRLITVEQANKAHAERFEHMNERINDRNKLMEEFLRQTSALTTEVAGISGQNKMILSALDRLEKKV